MGTEGTEDPRSVEELIEALGDDSDEVRGNAALAFTDFQDERAIKPLLKALKDPYPLVRESAAFALAEYKRKEHVEPLIELLQDEEAKPRWGAAWSLGKIGDLRAVDPLIAILNDIDDSVRQAAARSLGEIGDVRALKPLIEAIEDKDEYIRQAAVESLGKLGDKSVSDILINHLRDDSDLVRTASAGALGKLDQSRARKEVLKSINFQINDSLAKQEIKRLIPYSFGAGFFAAFAILLLELISENDVLSIFSLDPSVPFWVGFTITFLILASITCMIFFMFLLLMKSPMINSIAISLNGESFFSSDLFEILEKKLKTRYKIDLLDLEGLRFFVPTTKGKTYKVGIWECDFYEDNKFILSFYHYKQLDSGDQDFIVRSIKESAVESMITLDDE
jgi:hypothetical protein